MAAGGHALLTRLGGVGGAGLARVGVRLGTADRVRSRDGAARVKGRVRDGGACLVDGSGRWRFERELVDGRLASALGGCGVVRVEGVVALDPSERIPLLRRLAGASVEGTL